jgi:hypothetical protein
MYRSNRINPFVSEPTQFVILRVFPFFFRIDPAQMQILLR